uniref:RVT_N domain-containing protein n=1 Tax=Haemonchus contortus TaxID=6289 RepID=A0A7I4YCD3_HAECO
MSKIKRAAWRSFKDIEGVLKQAKNIYLLKHFGKDFLIHQVQSGIRSSRLRQRTKIRVAVAYIKEAKIRRVVHILQYRPTVQPAADWIARDVKRTSGW